MACRIPYFLGLGQIDAKFKMTFDPAVDESSLTAMLSNTQPALVWGTSNGLSGTNVVSATINAQLAGYEQADLSAVNQFWGFEVSGELVASATGAGNSGGNTVAQFVLVNNIPSYDAMDSMANEGITPRQMHLL